MDRHWRDSSVAHSLRHLQHLDTMLMMCSTHWSEKLGKRKERKKSPEKETRPQKYIPLFGKSSARRKVIPRDLEGGTRHCFIALIARRLRNIVDKFIHCCILV